MSWWDNVTGRKTVKSSDTLSGAEPHDTFVATPFDPNSAADVSSFLNTTALDPSNLHPLAGLDAGLEYLKLEDEALSDLPGAHSVLPSRGWSDDLCYGTGTTYLAALSMGGAWGFIEGVNRSPPSAPPKLKLNSILNGMTRRGPFLGNSAGVIAMVYNGINSTIGHVRGKHDTANSVVAGALSGAIFKRVDVKTPQVVSGTEASPVQNFYAKPGSAPVVGELDDLPTHTDIVILPTSTDIVPIDQGIVIPLSLPPVESATPTADDSTAQPTPTPDTSDLDLTPPGGGLSDEQAVLLQTITPQDLQDGGAIVQETVLEAAKQQLIDSNYVADVVVPDEPLPDPETVPDLEDYQDIQETGTNVTQTAQELGGTMEQLLDLIIDQIRFNETIDGTPNDLTPVDQLVYERRKNKRWLFAAIQIVALVLEGAKHASEIIDQGVKLFHTFSKIGGGN
ncbi:hypothetical protein Dda_4027 [Drechslerella dactyloides]|uniref:Uncharacterized protein n=1 Tax=Drechslerella dactyloides TaxID=74499 RepID=A0AAD6J3F7_DREDA|nr:hypothetical protein Dda_4027 [Drechslerella dactyloides]